MTPFGKRLFRIWLCMPLREVSAINARLDAVEDLLDAPSVEAEFAQLAKGLPDLERIVSRIHAGTCKVLDFLKVLQVRDNRSQPSETLPPLTNSLLPGFRKDEQGPQAAREPSTVIQVDEHLWFAAVGA